MGGIEISFSGSNIFTLGRSQPSDIFQSSILPYANTNTWVNISIVFNYLNKTISIYVNGVLGITNSVAFGSNVFIKGTSIQVDSIGSSAGQFRFFNGKISQFSLYKRALSPTEVLQNFNANRSRYGL